MHFPPHNCDHMVYFIIYLLSALKRALGNKPNEPWIIILICLSSFLLLPILPSFSWSSTPPRTKPEDNEAIKKESYQTRLEVSIILNCPSIIMKLTAISPRLTQNKSIQQQQFNFIFVKEVMNTNGGSNETWLTSNQVCGPLLSHRRFAMLSPLLKQMSSLMLLGEQHTHRPVLKKIKNKK